MNKKNASNFVHVPILKSILKKKTNKILIHVNIRKYYENNSAYDGYE